MIETSNPEIDVHELMERVRREAAKVREQNNGRAAVRIVPRPVTAPPVMLPPLPELPTPPGLGSSGPVEVKKDRLDALLKQARETTEVSHSIPKFLRGLFRKQGGYNRALLDAVASVVKTNVQLTKRVQELQMAAQQHNDWLRILIEHRAGDQAWMKAATPLISSFGNWQTQMAESQQRVQLVESSAAAAQSRLEQHSDRIADLMAQGERAGAHLRNLQDQIDRAEGASEHLRNLQVQVDRQAERLQDYHSNNERVAEHLRNLQTQADTSGEHLRNLQRTADQLLAIYDQNERAGEHLRNLQVQVDRHGERLQDCHGNNERVAEHLRNLQTQADTSGEHLRNLQRTADQLLAIYDQNERAAEHLRNLQVQVDRQSEFLKDLQEQEDRQNTHLQNLQDTANTSGEHLRNLQDETERAADQAKDVGPLKVTTARLEAEIQQLADLRRTLGRVEERQTNDAIYLKSQISSHSAVLQQWLRGEGKKKGADAPASVPPPALPAGELDDFYLTFENRFRGTRAEIKERVRYYLPFLKTAKAGTAARPILDLGCGRGEWLELLEENGLQASGVDLNSAMITQCAERKLTATQADAIEHLRSLPANSHGAISGFHIIEHLPFETLLQMFMQTLRVLKPGGLAIFESPNCKNLSVGACYFNVDPTHRNPVFPETAGFIMETQGFENVQLEYLSPADRRLTDGDQDAEILNDLLFGPQDFAVIGRKPRTR